MGMAFQREAMAPQRRGQMPATVRLGQFILRAVRRNGGALGTGPLILAVSGGTDSLAMLLAAATVRESIKREIVIAHFSHGLRKSAERREAALVRRTARELQVPLEHEQAETGRSEASARDARYAFLGRVARLHRAAAVATAHTQDDQAETLLLRLSRGTGLRGAGAIREFSQREVSSERLALLRPILLATRADTSTVCAEWKLTAASDGTNRSVRYARNRVRRRILPELAEINPDVAGALAAFAVTAQEDDDLLTRLATEAVAEIERREPTTIAWPVHVLRELPSPLLARVLQSAWAVLRGGGAALSRAQIESIKRSIVRGSGWVNLWRGATFRVEHEAASLSTDHFTMGQFEPTTLHIPGEAVFGMWAITAGIGPMGTISDDVWRARLDLNALGNNVCVRSRIEGDRFNPLGMEQEVRLQDVLVNAKVPRSQRDSLPLVVAGGRIAWVAGVRIADWAKVTRGTTRSALIEARPLS
jgi:tRNA(Ile)-lysidine synthase